MRRHGRSTSTSARRSSACGARSSRASASAARSSCMPGVSPPIRSFAARACRSRPTCATCGSTPRPRRQVYRIVQEALTNVRKHAAAQPGPGVDGDRRRLAGGSGSRTTAAAWQRADAPADVPHYGLRSMRERAAAIGATLELRDGPGGGDRRDARPAPRRARAHPPRADRLPDAEPAAVAAHRPRLTGAHPARGRPRPVPRRRRVAARAGVTRWSARPPTGRRPSRWPRARARTSCSWTWRCRAAASRRPARSRRSGPAVAIVMLTASEDDGRPVRGDQGRGPRLPAQEPRRGGAPRDARGRRARRGRDHAGHRGPHHRGVRPSGARADARRRPGHA